jgi:hypothetical protein
MGIAVLDMTVEAAAAIARGRVVVRSGEGKASPAGANPNLRHTILGVSLQSQDTVGRSLAVRRAGIAEVEASAAVAAGETVTVSGAGGRIRPVAIPTLTVNGAGGNTLVLTPKAFDPAMAGLRVVVTNPGTNNAALAVAATPAGFEVSLATNGSGAATTTLAQLRTAILASATGYRFTGGYNGSDTAVVTTGIYTIGAFPGEDGAIGIAQAAGASGSFVPVLLTL